MPPEIVEVDLNLDVDGDYERFILDLREKLAHHPQRLEYIAKHGAWLEDHPLLPVQVHPRQPARWIHINLVAEDKNTRRAVRTTVAVRDDNVYLIGFKNGNGKWYEFGFENKSAKFIEGSTFLGCDVSYSALVRESANDDLVNLTVGKYPAIGAVCTLSGYEQAVPADANTRLNLARMCVMICESARMMPHYSIVTQGWNHVGRRISAEHAGYIKNWRSMSRKLLSTKDPSPERDRLLDVVHLLLNSPEDKSSRQEQSAKTRGGGGKSQQGAGSSNPLMPSSSGPASGSSSTGGGGGTQQGQTTGKSVRGRPLVEVFGIDMYGSGDVVGTIAVFDGKRGQIIYKHDLQETLRSYYPYRAILPLTGPYRAISAEGSFAIQVSGITSGTDASDESSEIIGEMFWDCYAKDVVYDKVLTSDIISTGAGQRTLAGVTYAVLSDAVEATMEVNLLIPGITHVRGVVRARYAQYLGFTGKDEIMLFNRGTYEKAELVPSGAGSKVPLELVRSVIAVPVLRRYSVVQVYVELYVAHPNKKGEVPLEGYIQFYLDKNTGEIRNDHIGEFFVPVGWAGVSDSKGGGHQGTEQTSMQQVKVQVNIASPGFHVSPLEPESADVMWG